MPATLSIYQTIQKSITFDLSNRQLTGRIVFEGGVDTQVTMMRGTPEDVRAEALLRLGQLGRDPRGGLLLWADQNMPFSEEGREAGLHAEDLHAEMACFQAERDMMRCTGTPGGMDGLVRVRVPQCRTQRRPEITG